MPYAYEIRDRERIKRGVLAGLLLVCLALLVLMIRFGVLAWSTPGREDDRKSEESSAAESSVVRLAAGRTSAPAPPTTGVFLGLAPGTGTAQWLNPAAACTDCADHVIAMSISSAVLSGLDDAQHTARSELGSMMAQMAAGSHSSWPSGANRVGGAGSTGAGGTGGAGGNRQAASESSEDTPGDVPLTDFAPSTPAPGDLSPVTAPRQSPGSPDTGSGPGGGRPGHSDDSDGDDRGGTPPSRDEPGGLAPSAPGPGGERPFQPPVPGAPDDNEKIIKELTDNPIGPPIADTPVSNPVGPSPAPGPSVDDSPVATIPEPSPVALLGMALFAAAAYRFRRAR